MLDAERLMGRLEGDYQARLGETGTTAGLRALGDGFETSVFAYRPQGAPKPLILRLYSPGGSAPMRAANECHVLRGLHSAGYPVPEALRFEADSSYLGGPFLIMEHVRGATLQAQLEDRPETLELFCELLARLHRLDWRPFIGAPGPWQTTEQAEATFGLGWLSGTVTQYGSAAAFRPLLDWLTERGRGIAPRPAVIHGDYHPLNILVDEVGVPSVLDWGSAAVADYRLDVANAVIMAYALGQPHLAGPMLAGYEAAAGERVGDLDYFQALVLTRRLAIMAAAMLHGAEAVGLKPGADEHLRRHSHLAQGVHAWLAGLTGLDLPGVTSLLAASSR